MAVDSKILISHPVKSVSDSGQLSHCESQSTFDFGKAELLK